jgi:hypothetical protein
MVPCWDLSGHINDLTSKKIPLAACESRKKLATSSPGCFGQQPEKAKLLQSKKLIRQTRNHESTKTTLNQEHTMFDSLISFRVFVLSCFAAFALRRGLIIFLGFLLEKTPISQLTDEDEGAQFKIFFAIQKG